MDSLISDILIVTCTYLEYDNLINFQIMHDLRLLVQNTKSYYIILIPKSEQTLKFLINNFSFTKYDVSDKTGLMTMRSHYFRNCHTIDLSLCDNITDTNVKELLNCGKENKFWRIFRDCEINAPSTFIRAHTLYLSLTNITDASIKELRNCAKENPLMRII